MRTLVKNMNRKRYEKIQAIQNTLERHGRFDYDYIPFGNKWVMPDANYVYRQRGFSRLATGFWRTLMATFAPLALKLIYGAKVVGKKNRKALGKQGAVCVCNHFNYLDTLFVRQATGYYRSYHTMGPFNNKKGLGGHIIRHGGMLPFSKNMAAMKGFMRETERLLKKGKIVNFYAEQAMWLNYQKPRPMKEGAFYYALKYGVPVLPLFCTFRKNKCGKIRKLRIHILPAIYANEDLPKGERLADMKTRAEHAWKNCYEANYGIALEYLPRERRE